MPKELEMICSACGFRWASNPDNLEPELCPKCGATGEPDLKSFLRGDKLFVPETLTEFLGKPIPEADPVIAKDGKLLLDSGGRLLVHAYSKKGKTQFVLQLAFGIALGKPTLGFEFAKPRRVLYLNGELSERQLRKRMEFLLANGFNVTDNFLLEKVDADFFLKRTDELIANLIASEVEVLIFDPLYKLNNGDESLQDLKKITTALDTIRDETGVSIIIVHHQAKQSLNTNSRPAQQQARGSSHLTDWFDCVFSFYPQQRKLPYIQISVDGREDPIDDLFYKLDNNTRIYTPITKEQAQALTPVTTANLRQEIVNYISERGSVTKSELNSRFTHHYHDLNPAVNELINQGILNKVRLGRADIYTVVVNASDPHGYCNRTIDIDNTRSANDDGETGVL